MRIFNICFIVLFMFMLILPLVCVDLSTDRVSIQENRMLANPPKLSDMKKNPRIFFSGFNTWFKDSTGFREQLLTIFNVVDKNTWLNGVMYREGQTVYLIGEQGHHYLAGANGFMIQKFQGKPFLTDKQLQNMADKLEEVRIWLDSKGIPLVVMFCTDKESLYPEFYPKPIKRGPEPIQLDVITNYLQDNTNVDVFNIRQGLLTEKDNYLLYNVDSNDFGHYNQIGAFFTYRELMKHINTYFPQIVPYELDDMEISYSRIGIPYVSLKTGFTYKKYDPSFFDDVNLIRPFDPVQNVAYENAESDLPVILFLRDSFSNEERTGKYFAQQFSKAFLIRHNNLNNLKEYIDRYKPDIVVFESAERLLSDFANSVAEIPELP